MNIEKMLSSKSFTYATKGIMGAVVGTTILKAVGRPAFIYADKHSDKETKKYTAAKEFLYQMLCLIMTFAMVIPVQMLCFKLSKKYIKLDSLKGIKTYGDFGKVTTDLDELTPKAKAVLNNRTTELTPDEKEEIGLTKGAVELGSFVGSLVGLTIVAPLISHEILHPIMGALGLDKKPASITPLNEHDEEIAAVKKEKETRKA